MLQRILNRDAYDSIHVALREVRESISHADKIAELTHNLYKYPACFPPSFPRAVLSSFSKVDDWVLDPFVGGGTGAVEAMAAGRNFVGSDLNDLAIFSSKLKTTLLNKKDIQVLDQWMRTINVVKAKAEVRENDSLFFKNAPRAVEQSARKIKAEISRLPSPKLRDFATGALLRLSQLEVEHRIPANNLKQIEWSYKELLNDHIEQAMKLVFEVDHGQSNFIPTNVITAADAADPSAVDVWSQHNREFKLVLTSPPYPERHILYHKWQVNGRTETRLPYWIIGSNQIENEPFYTMASRDSSLSLELYISNMVMVFENINHVMAKNGLFVQVVAFSDVARQLPLYLAALNETGFEEIRNIVPSSFDGRLWRTVPHRKWFNRVMTEKNRCKEVVLFHRKARGS